MNEQRLDLKYCNILICSSSEDLDYWKDIHYETALKSNKKTCWVKVFFKKNGQVGLNYALQHKNNVAFLGYSC